MTTAPALPKRSGTREVATWPTVTVDDVFKIQQGKALSAAARTASERYPFLRTTNVLWNCIDVTSVDRMGMSEEEQKRLRLSAGDLLVCEGGEIGRAAVWRGEIRDCAYQNHIHRLRPRDEADPDFFAYWFRYAFTMTDLYEGAGTKTTIANLSGGRLGGLPIPLPPLDEQRRIARTLRIIQGARGASENVRFALSSLRMATVLRLFSRQGWQKTKLGEVMALQRGHDLPSRARLPGDVPVVSSAGITGSHNESKAAGPGVVMGRYGTLGVVHYIDGPYWPLNTTLYVKDFRGNHPRFVAFFLETLEYEQHNDKTSVPGINRNDIHALTVEWPAIDEQRRISTVLETIDARVGAERRLDRSLELLFRSVIAGVMEQRA